MSQPADLDVDRKLDGELPDGSVATYQITRIRARCGYTSHDGNRPFQTNFGAGPQPETAATYDAVTGTAEQVGLRHIDPYGNVMDVWKMMLVDWYWKLDGCPTPLTLAKIASYMAAATPIRPWPTGFAGAQPGEPTQTYPAWPPVVPAMAHLDSVVAQETHPLPEVHYSVPPVHDGLGGLKNQPLLGDVLKAVGSAPSPSEVNKVYADYARQTLPTTVEGSPGPPPDMLSPTSEMLQALLNQINDMDRRMRAAGL